MEVTGLGLPPTGAVATLALAALAAGLARGFSGFGAALIFIPLAAAAIGPQQAAPLMLLIEFVAVVSLAPGAWRLADRREVAWLTAGAVLGTPLGAALLLAADPVSLRWAVAALILGLLALVASGWRYTGPPHAGAAVGVGGVAGVLAGVALVPGPPVLAYLLGRDMPAARLRAVFNLFLAACGLVAAAIYAAVGLFGARLIGPMLVTGPIYALGIWLGARMFGLASERSFRRVCYAMIALSALLGLPLWDGLLR